jgi:transposase
MEAAVNRLILSDEEWARIATHLRRKVGDPDRSAADNRMFLESALWIARAGAPWGDLPEKFCKWNSVALKADVRRDGQFLILLTAEVVPADVFRVRPGDVVPADQPVVWAAHSSSP